MLRLLRRLPISELKKLRTQLSAKKPRKISIPVRELRKFVKQERSTRSIAQFFKVSPRTITRRIREFGLRGIRRRGRKPSIIKPTIKKLTDKWIPTRTHFDRLHRIYRFVNIRYPAVRYINARTLACSNTKSNPRGKFTTVGIYYVVEESNVHLLFQTRIRYTEDPVSFNEIYGWVNENAFDMVSNLVPKDVFVIQIIAFTFMGSKQKPAFIKVS